MAWNFVPDFAAEGLRSADLKLAVALGYRYVRYQIGTRPITEYVLPPRPFKKFGPVVIVTEMRAFGDQRRRIHKLRFISNRQVARRWNLEVCAVPIINSRAA